MKFIFSDYTRKQKIVFVKSLLVIVSVQLALLSTYTMFLLHMLEKFTVSFIISDPTTIDNLTVFFFISVLAVLFFISRAGMFVCNKLELYTPDDLKHVQKQLEKIQKSLEKSK